MAPGAIRILLADDHEMFRHAIKRMLNDEPGIEVVGEARDGAEVLDLASRVTADILLLDLLMPVLSGLETLQAFEERGIAIRTIVLTGSDDRDDIVEALHLGIRGIVSKDSPFDLLVKCIRRVMAGEYWIGHDRIADLVESVSERARRPVDSLTRRELQIVSAVVQGATNKQISGQLGLSEQTIKNHLSSIFDKLGVSNRLELALYAVHHSQVVKACAG
jgi:two-component system nitrate/nitrite response regulator NarL